MRKCWLVLVLMLVSLLPVRAAEKKGVAIVPPFEDITINSETQKDFDLIIINQTNVEEVFELSVVDFGSLNETGGVAFLTTKVDSSQRKYSLASWISLEKSEAIVASGQSQIVKVTILNKDSLSPGGHYGAVLVTINTNDSRQTDSVGVNQTLASLLYVLKTGGEVYKMGLKEMVIKNNIWGMPNNLTVRLINEGNVHVVPRGDFEIYRGNQMVAKGILNEASGKILPESVRVFNFGIKKLSQWNWPGKYQTRLNLRYDGKDEFEVTNGTFFYWGYEGWILGGTFLIILYIIFLKIGKKI